MDCEWNETDEKVFYSCVCVCVWLFCCITFIGGKVNASHTVALQRKNPIR